MGLWVFWTLPKAWDSPGTLKLSQKPWTVPGLWDCPRRPRQSLAYVTVPKTQSPDFLRFYFLSNYFKENQTLNIVGTVPIAWDRLGIPGFLAEPHKSETVLRLWDCFRSPGQSQAFRTVPKTQSPTSSHVWVFIFLKIVWLKINPMVLGLWAFGTVLGLWDCTKSQECPGDCPKDPESWHHGVLFLVKLFQEKKNSNMWDSGFLGPDTMFFLKTFPKL